MQAKPDYSLIPTEAVNGKTEGLDRLCGKETVSLINEETSDFKEIIKPALKQIAQAADLMAQSFLNGANIVFAGAGTSGRLGVIEAAELTPTFGIEPERLIALIAGGPEAVFKSKEGAEDNEEAGADECSKKVKAGDFVAGICASGVTPYVRGVLKKAKEKGAKTVLITCNKNISADYCDVIIAVDSGAEILSGSTRMKAGTATKIILNNLTTSAMVAAGKVYKNFMVDVKPTCAKLKARAIRITAHIAKISPQESAETLELAGWQVKEAIVMAVKKVNLVEAENLLLKHKGFLKDIIG